MARDIWWNFVSSRRERIEQAKADWNRDRFEMALPEDDEEFIPLPDRRIVPLMWDLHRDHRLFTYGSENAP